MHVEFFSDPQAFSDRAGDFLRTHARDCSVIASQTTRQPVANEPYWFAAICDGETVVNVAMRTKPHAPHALFLPKMSDEHIAALALALKDREEDITAANGNVDSCTALLSSLGRTPRVTFRSRLFFLESVDWPKRPEGTLRQATMGDYDLIAAWNRQYVIDAEADAGREASPETIASLTSGMLREKELRGAIQAGLYWFWEVDGTPVHMTRATEVGFGIAHFGPVFTPMQHRGRGYAGWVVARLSQDFLDRGLTPRLYTDQANPISNRVYEKIGFVAHADEGEVEGY